MTDTAQGTAAPPEWVEVLAESEADLAAGRIVSGDVVMRDLGDAIARLKSKPDAKPKREVAGRR
jgi:hypothetical protein